ncbi:hypothetical protein [Mycolicibacterium helvum]|uniref:Uncharacterized protein n=1 Tax=Mycolicibacterium helvum TaxID=1534349 RepID=A0A7I7T7H8_9MYCO|nr:hypothetical protein [Mycolicibacterium helvum]BBY64225.1 hypothetical protein MHEL_24680 [Mycolicibacterium helvum]
MNQDSHCQPLFRMVAVVATGVVIAATPVVAPPNPAAELTGARISTQVVQLVALPQALASQRPETTVAASASPLAIGNLFTTAISQVAAGVSAGLFLGFLVGGQIAASVIYRIPVAQSALTPLISVGALVGALVGAPIGAIVGAVFAVERLVQGVFSAVTPAASIRPAAAGGKATATSHRSTQPSSRSSRQIVKPSASTSSKAALPQQRSVPARAGSGSGRVTATNRVARH